MYFWLQWWAPTSFHRNKSDNIIQVAVCVKQDFKPEDILFKQTVTAILTWFAVWRCSPPTIDSGWATAQPSLAFAYGAQPGINFGLLCVIMWQVFSDPYWFSEEATDIRLCSKSGQLKLSSNHNSFKKQNYRIFIKSCIIKIKSVALSETSQK